MCAWTSQEAIPEKYIHKIYVTALKGGDHRNIDVPVPSVTLSVRSHLKTVINSREKKITTCLFVLPNILWDFSLHC